jgi:hypothetical protein
MNYERYTDLEISTDSLEYKFISTGPKGEIIKVIQFSQTSEPTIYNLAFGNLTINGDIDDITVNDNKDRNKILATIAFAVYDFTERKYGITLFFTGSTPERTRLYRMAISLNLNELRKDFHIYGLVKDASGYI